MSTSDKVQPLRNRRLTFLTSHALGYLNNLDLGANLGTAEIDLTNKPNGISSSEVSGPFGTRLSPMS